MKKIITLLLSLSMVLMGCSQDTSTSVNEINEAFQKMYKQDYTLITYEDLEEDNDDHIYDFSLSVSYIYSSQKK